QPVLQAPPALALPHLVQEILELAGELGGLHVLLSPLQGGVVPHGPSVLRERGGRDVLPVLVPHLRPTRPLRDQWTRPRRADRPWNRDHAWVSVVVGTKVNPSPLQRASSPVEALSLLAPQTGAQTGSHRHPLLYMQTIASPFPARPVRPWSEVRQN